MSIGAAVYSSAYWKKNILECSITRLSRILPIDLHKLFCAGKLVARFHIWREDQCCFCGFDGRVLLRFSLLCLGLAIRGLFWSQSASKKRIIAGLRLSLREHWDRQRPASPSLHSCLPGSQASSRMGDWPIRAEHCPLSPGNRLPFNVPSGILYHCPANGQQNQQLHSDFQWTGRHARHHHSFPLYRLRGRPSASVWVWEVLYRHFLPKHNHQPALSRHYLPTVHQEENQAVLSQETGQTSKPKQSYTKGNRCRQKARGGSEISLTEVIWV